MEKFLTVVLANSVAFTIAGAAILYLGKRLFSGTLEHYLAKLMEQYKARTEIEKQKESFVLGKQQAMFPEIVDLV